MMKKISALLLLCLLCPVLAACSSNEQPALQPEQQDILYENGQHGFSLLFPADWEGKYVIKESDDMVSIYHLATMQEQEGSGRLFDLHVFSRERWEAEGEELADMIALRPIYEGDNLVLALGFPTDVQISLGNDELRAEYRRMEEEISGIVESLRVK